MKVDIIADKLKENLINLLSWLKKIVKILKNLLNTGFFKTRIGFFKNRIV